MECKASQRLTDASYCSYLLPTERHLVPVERFKQYHTKCLCMLLKDRGADKWQKAANL